MSFHLSTIASAMNKLGGVQMNAKQKKVFAIGAIGLLVAGVGAAVGAIAFPREVTVTKYQTQIVEKEIPVEVEKIVEVTKEVPVEVIKEVDNENLALVLDHIYDNAGNVEYLIDDLDDDEVSLIVDRVVFINDVKSLAVNAIQDDLFDELDGEVIGEVELDDKDMEKLKIDDDDEDLIVSDVDFEDKDAEVTVTGSFKQDDVKYDFEVKVNFKDGEYDDMDIVSVVEAE